MSASKYWLDDYISKTEQQSQQSQSIDSNGIELAIEAVRRCLRATQTDPNVDEVFFDLILIFLKKLI